MFLILCKLFYFFIFYSKYIIVILKYRLKKKKKNFFHCVYLSSTWQSGSDRQIYSYLGDHTETIAAALALVSTLVLFSHCIHHNVSSFIYSCIHAFSHSFIYLFIQLRLQIALLFQNVNVRSTTMLTSIAYPTWNVIKLVINVHYLLW